MNRMEKEYDLCMNDLNSPSLRICLGLLILMGCILTPIGVIGMFKAWGPLDVFTVIFGIGVSCAGLSILIMIYTAIAYCLRD